MNTTKLGMSENIEAAIAYSVPPLAVLSGIIMLVLETDNKFVRFHAMQSFIVFAFYGFAGAILGFIPFIGRPLAGFVGLIAFVSWLIMIINAFMGKCYKYPFFGEAIYEKIVG